MPRQARHPYPIVFFHGNGQTGAVWRQTPDNRAGWAYYLVAQGYTVYMVDYPARGRSPYVPGVDGKLGIRTALDLEHIWTAPATSGGNFPRMKLYTQWPSDSPKKGMMGDPNFALDFHGTRWDVAKSGELGFAQGSYTMTMTNPKTKKGATDKGKYLTVFKKQADGTWKAVEDMVSSDGPMAPAK